MAATNRVTRLYAIYRNPRDYPGKIVVRKWGVINGKVYAWIKPLIVTDSLDAAHAILPSGLALLSPLPQDDPAIIEVWL